MSSCQTRFAACRPIPTFLAEPFLDFGREFRYPGEIMAGNLHFRIIDPAMQFPMIPTGSGHTDLLMFFGRWHIGTLWKRDGRAMTPHPSNYR
ncbi:MAG: hypothetical protein HQL74_08730 [Magnetococcales bacterium]|nr:hypothetical protein [Magnetococcales bacterium]